MELQAILDRVDQILIDEFELPREEVVPGATLKGDLDLDSLDGLDLIVALEKEFGVRVDESALLKLETVGEIHGYIRVLFASEGTQSPEAVQPQA